MMKGHTAWNKGKKGVQSHSIESRKKIGLANKGKILSQETRDKISLNHAFRGKHFSEEHKEKLRLNHKGMTGKHFSQEHIENIRKRQTGRKLSEETKRKIGEHNYMKGKKLSEENKKKLFDANFGKHRTEETKRKISESNKIALKGLKYSPERRRIASKCREGSKSHFWKGGISYEPYSIDWTKTLKRAIRERDKYTCQICNKMQADEAFAVHHIDYNKLNCNTNNLITLCPNCHMKTNHDRQKWIEFFKNLNEENKWDFFQNRNQ